MTAKLGAAGNDNVVDVLSHEPGWTNTTPPVLPASATATTRPLGTYNALTSNALNTATTSVDSSAAAAPTNGQVLTAIDGSTASWQDATGGSGGGISPPAGDIGGTAGSPTVVATHLSSALPTAQGGTGNTSGNAATATTASGLTSATTTVAVSAATAPSLGQVLTATSSTAATWQPPSGGSSFTSWGPSATGAGLGLLTFPLVGAGNAPLNKNVFMAWLVTAGVSQNVTTLGMQMPGSSSATSPSTGVNELALYSVSGTTATLLQATGDMTTAFEGTGTLAEGSITSTAITAGSNYYLAVLCNFTSAPNFEYAFVIGAPSYFNIGNTVPQVQITSQLTMPSSFTTTSSKGSNPTFVVWAR